MSSSPQTATAQPAAPRVFAAAADRIAAETRVAIVVARWNETITRRLLDAAVASFTLAGLPATALDVIWVPGSFELTLVADRIAAGGRHAAVVCLGAIIKGETSHDQHIARAVAHGIEEVGRMRGLPVVFGVLTCDTLAQAMARAGDNGTAAGADRFAGNKGAEAAAAAIEMVALVRQLRSSAVCP
jgi:6,7-dimethyl-8-ribityllumazine synthase